MTGRTPRRAEDSQRDLNRSLPGAGSAGATLIAPKPLPVQIASYLRDLILHDKIKPGERIREQAVADKLSVSRTPLREALTILASEGLVTSDPNRGSSVALQGEDTLSGAQMVEAKLESLAGAIVTDSDNTRTIQFLRRQLGKIQRAANKNDPATVFSEEQLFFKKIVGATNNKPLINLHENISIKMYRERYLRAIGYRIQSGKPEKIGNIVDAIEGGSAEQVSSLIFAYRSSWN